VGGHARLRALVRNYVAAAHDVGEEADERLRRTIDDLRRESAPAVVEIARALGEAPAKDFPARAALIHAAAALEHSDALPLLVTLVDTPVPPEREAPSHGLGTTAEEIILRTTAVEGVGRAARDGDEAALSALIRFIESPVFSIRRASVQAALFARPDDDAVRQRLLAALPRDQHFLLDLKQLSVGEVEQPEGDQHRKRGQSTAPPDPADRRRQPDREEPPTSR